MHAKTGSCLGEVGTGLDMDTWEDNGGHMSPGMKEIAYRAQNINYKIQRIS